VIIWLDAQLSPRLTPSMQETFTLECSHVRDFGCINAEDAEIFGKARIAGGVIMTKDEDFVQLVQEKGSPPQVIWVTCGNMANTRFKEILRNTLDDAILLIAAGEPIVEIHLQVGPPAPVVRPK